MTVDKNELVESILRTFKGVPNFEEADALEFVDEAIAVNEKGSSADLVLLYAQSRVAWSIAVSTAHYFKYKDGEEEVDKTGVAENYRRLAKDFQTEYDLLKGKIHGSNFRTMTRIDRPRTTPPTGKSGRNLWRRF